MDGCVGGLVRMAVAPAKMVSGPGVWPRLTVLSLTGNIIPFSLIAWAEQSVPSAEVGILMALMPIANITPLPTGCWSMSR
ncbi:MAG: hypothetical protein CM15mP125_1610 [Gammaproteobacteria bacterium]|nr:MAG: hypothetical protein CM15mP125_1610 [Gammaproteobacteria bacterium]